MPTYDIFQIKGTEYGKFMRPMDNMEHPVGFFDSLAPALRIHNSVASALSSGVSGHYEYDPEYRSVDDPLNADYLDYDAIFDADSAEHAADLRRSIDRQNEDREYLARAGGWTNFATTTVAVGLDPITAISMLIPGGAAYRGASIGRAVALEAGAAVAGESLAELALHSSQEMRTLDESALNLIGAATIGAVLGGAIGVVGGRKNPSVRVAEREVMEIVNDISRDAGSVERGSTMTYNVRTTEEAEAALQAEIARRDREGLPAWTQEEVAAARSILRGEMAGNSWLVRQMARITPLNLLESKSVAARHLSRHMGEVSAEFLGNEASPVAIESLIKRHISRKEDVDRLAIDVWRQAKKAGEITDRQGAFMESVGRAMRRTEPTGNAAVDRVVEAYRKRVYEPLTREALDIGLFDQLDAGFREAYKQYNAAGLSGMTRSKFLDDIEAKFESGERYDLTGLDPQSRQYKSASKVNNYLDRLAEDGERPRALRLVGAEEYLNRVYDKAKIAQYPEDFKNILRNHFRQVFESDVGALEARYAEGATIYQKDRAILGELEGVRKEVRGLEKQVSDLRAEKERLLKEQQIVRPSLDAKLGRSEASLVRANKRLRGAEKAAAQIDMREFRRLDRLRERLREAEALLEDLDGVVDSIYSKIAGSRFGRLPPGVSYKGTPLNPRVLNIPDEKIEPFLDNNIMSVSSVFAREMAASIEFHKRFDGRDMGEVIGEVELDWNKVIEKAPRDERTRRLLTNEKTRDIEDLKAMWERLNGMRGYYHDPTSMLARAGNYMRAITLMSKLGRMTLSAISDLARPLMVHGQAPAARMAARLLTDANFRQMNTKQLHRAGMVSEVVSNARVNQLAEYAEMPSSLSKGERRLHQLTYGFSKATGMVHMNEGTKLWAGAIYGDELAKAIRKGDPTARVLKNYGVDRQMMDQIRKQLDQFGITDRGVTLPNTATWTDRAAADVVDAATRKAIDETIVTPGVFDRPKWMDTETGKLFGQFRSFMFASTNKTAIAGLTGHQAAFYLGMAEMTFLGVMAYAIKGTLAGRGDEVGKVLSGEDPWKLANEAVAQSGLGVMPEIWAMTARMLVPDKAAARYAVRNNLGTFVGPNFGTLETAFEVIQAAARQGTGVEGWSERNSRQLLRLVPYQNLWYLQALYSRIPGMEWTQ